MKYKWLFLIWCFSSGLTIAQPFNQRYILNQTAVDFDNFHLRGDTLYVFGFGTTFTPPYPAKVLFGKFDLNGNLISYDITIQDSSFTYTPYRQGSTSRRGNEVIVVGGGGMGTNPNQKGFYALYNLDTGLVWFKEFYESSAQFFLTNVCMTKDGGAFLLGHHFQSNFFYPKLYKIDSLGTIVWDTTFNCPGNVCYTRRIFEESDTTFLISMSRRINQDPIFSYTRIIRINLEGQILLDWEDDDGRTYAARKIVKTDDGGIIYVGFYFTDEDDGTPLNQGHIVHLNSQFDKQWELKTGTPTFITELNNLIRTHDGHYLAVGNTYDTISLDTTYTHAGHIIKFSEEGQIFWERRHFGIESNFEWNRFYDVVELPNNDIVLCGHSVDFNADSFPYQGWLVRLNEYGTLDSITNITEAEYGPEAGFIMYPNPAQNHLEIQSIKDPMKNLQIFNSLGQQVYATKPDTWSLLLNISSWPAGRYYVQIDDKPSQVFIKL